MNRIKRLSVKCILLFVGLSPATSWAQDSISEPLPSPADSSVSVDTVLHKMVPGNKKRKRSARRKAETRFYGFVGRYYDNNVFDYSKDDRKLFDTATVPIPRISVESLDDYLTDFGARLTCESGGRKSSAWRARLKADATLYERNSIRNYAQWGVELRKNLSRYYCELNFTWLPHLNVRKLYWRPMPERPTGLRYKDADLNRLSYGLEIGSSLAKNCDGRINVGITSTDYNFPFNERDNESTNESIRLTADVTKRLSVFGSAGLIQCRAGGRDSLNPIVKDISYNATTMSTGVRVGLDSRSRFVAATALYYQHQKYLSTKPADDGHYQRKDNDYEVDASLSWRVSPRWQPEFNFSHRASSSSVITNAVDFSSYDATRFGVQLTAYF